MPTAAQLKSYQRYRAKYIPKKSKKQLKLKVSRSVAVATPKDVRKIAKNVIMKNTEQKYFDWNHGKTELYHNSYTIGGKFLNVLDNAILPTQGDTDNSRDGNQIYVSGVSIPMMLYTKGDRLNTKFRVIAFKYSQGYNPNATYEALFDNISGNVMLDKVNPDTVKIIFDKTIGNTRLFPGGTGNDELTMFRKFWIPIKRKFTFRADNSTYFNTPNFNIGVAVVAYDTYGSITGTDNIGAVQLWTRLYFKDV